MAKRRARTRHPGVTIYERSRPKRGRVDYYFKWSDPDTKKKVSLSARKLGLTTKEAREKWAMDKSEQLHRRRAAIAAGAPKRSHTECREAIRRYLESCERRLSEGSVRSYRKSMNAFMEWAEARGIGSIEALSGVQLFAFRECQTAQPRLAPKKGGDRGERQTSAESRAIPSVNRVLREVKAALNWMSRQGWCHRLSRDDIADALKRLPEKRELPDYLTPADISKLLAACLSHDRETFDMTRDEKAGQLPIASTPRYTPIAPILSFVLLTGCRIAEALNLRWDSVDLDARDEYGKIVGEITLEAAETKTNAARKIDLSVSPALRRMLIALHEATPGEFVFGGQEPYSSHTWYNSVNRLKDKYETPDYFTAKVLRQTCATFLTNGSIFGASSVSAYRSARQLGHDVKVAERHYLGLLRGVPRDARTLEAAMQIEDLMEQLLARVATCRAPA